MTSNYKEDISKIKGQLNKISSDLKQLKTNRLLPIVAIVLSFLSIVLVALPQAPKVYFYGDSVLFSDNRYCLPKISIFGDSFSVGFVNTGKDVTKLKFYIDGENIRIQEGRQITHGEKFPYENDLTWISILLPYDTQRSLAQDYSIQILNSSNQEAKINSPAG